MTKFEGTLSEFINQIKFNRNDRSYLKKPRGRQIIHLWWEDYDKTKDRAFMNVATGKSNEPDLHEAPLWVIEKDIYEYLNFLYIRHGFELFT